MQARQSRPTCGVAAPRAAKGATARPTRILRPASCDPRPATCILQRPACRQTLSLHAAPPPPQRTPVCGRGAVASAASACVSTTVAPNPQVPGPVGSRRSNGPSPSASCEGRRASKRRLPVWRLHHTLLTPAIPRRRSIATVLSLVRGRPAQSPSFFLFSVSRFWKVLFLETDRPRRTDTTMDARFFSNAKAMY